MNIIASVFSQYFYLRQTIPLFVYTFYIIFRDADNPLIDKFLKTGLKVLGICILYLSINCILGKPFQEIIPFTWSYSGPITWGLLFFNCFYVLKGKKENTLTSFTIAMLAVVGGGWLYEVSFFHPVSMFLGKESFFYINIQIICWIFLFVEMKIKSIKLNPIIYITLISSFILGWSSFPYPNSQIICLLLFLYELSKRNFKPNKFIYATLILFTAFSIIMFVNDSAIHTFTISAFKFTKLIWSYSDAQTLKWIYRIPASLFLLSLLSGIKKNSEMIENV